MVGQVSSPHARFASLLSRCSDLGRFTRCPSGPDINHVAANLALEYEVKKTPSAIINSDERGAGKVLLVNLLRRRLPSCTHVRGLSSYGRSDALGCSWKEVDGCRR
eukprot:760149-Hanusia_phi.AAC.9